MPGIEMINGNAVPIVEYLYLVSMDRCFILKGKCFVFCHIKSALYVCTVGTGEAADLFMCPEGRPTIPFTELLLRQGSRRDTLSRMT